MRVAIPTTVVPDIPARVPGNIGKASNCAAPDIVRQRRLPGTVREGRLIRTLALVALLAASIGPTTGAAESVHAPVIVSTVSRGMRLTLVVPRDQYQLNALARVSITMTNISPHAITVRTVPSDLGGPYLPVAVQDVHGNRSVLPGASFELRPYSRVTGYHVLPGHSIRVDRFVVVTGPRLVAFAETLPPNGTSVVHTPTARVTLVPGVTLKLTVRGRSGRRFLQAGPPSASSAGPLRYIQSLHCARPHGYALRAQVAWVAVPHRSIFPACRPILEWQVVAGYLNQPVAAIDYTTRPHRQGGPVMPTPKPQG
jgi:hypothetical protein